MYNINRLCVFLLKNFEKINKQASRQLLLPGAGFLHLSSRSFFFLVCFTRPGAAAPLLSDSSTDVTAAVDMQNNLFISKA